MYPCCNQYYSCILIAICFPSKHRWSKQPWQHQSKTAPASGGHQRSRQHPPSRWPWRQRWWPRKRRSVFRRRCWRWINPPTFVHLGGISLDCCCDLRRPTRQNVVSPVGQAWVLWPIVHAVGMGSSEFLSFIHKVYYMSGFGLGGQCEVVCLVVLLCLVGVDNCINKLLLLLEEMCNVLLCNLCCCLGSTYLRLCICITDIQ